MTSLVRMATHADAAALAALRWEFRAGRSTPVEERDAFVSRCAAWMRMQLESGDAWRAWVTETDGRLVGQVWLHLILKVPNPVGERERHGYISNLYVTPDARGGVGTQLLRTAIRWCESMGVDSILLQATPRSRPLYLRSGFSEHADFLQLKLH